MLLSASRVTHARTSPSSARSTRARARIYGRRTETPNTEKPPAARARARVSSYCCTVCRSISIYLSIYLQVAQGDKLGRPRLLVSVASRASPEPNAPKLPPPPPTEWGTCAACVAPHVNRGISCRHGPSAHGGRDPRHAHTHMQDAVSARTNGHRNATLLYVACACTYVHGMAAWDVAPTNSEHRGSSTRQVASWACACLDKRPSPFQSSRLELLRINYA